jgi:hypothetical protein
MTEKALKLAYEVLLLANEGRAGWQFLIPEALSALKEVWEQPEQEPVSQYYDTQLSEQERNVIAARGLEPLVFNRIVPPVQRTEQEPVQEPVAWPCHIIKADFFKKTITLGMQCSDYKVGAGQHWLHTTPPAAQPAVPDAIGPNEDELPAYAAGWNDCRQAMLKARGNT